VIDAAAKYDLRSSLDPERRIAELEAELVAKDALIIALNERIAEQDTRIEALTRQVAELLQRLGRNSNNSDLPPSRDGPGARPRGKGKSTNKKPRGGHPGHGGSRRVQPRRPPSLTATTPGCTSRRPRTSTTAHNVANRCSVILAESADERLMRGR
jgi:uncharacterized coiled-coil protein SlyX